MGGGNGQPNRDERQACAHPTYHQSMHRLAAINRLMDSHLVRAFGGDPLNCADSLAGGYMSWRRFGYKNGLHALSVY